MNIAKMNNIKRNLDYVRIRPEEAAIEEDVDGVLFNDAAQDICPKLVETKGLEDKGIDFADSFLWPFYKARERGKLVALDDERKRTVIVEPGHDGAVLPHIGDELINFQRVLVAGLPKKDVENIIRGFEPRYLVNRSAPEYIQKMKERFGEGLVAISGSFYELIDSPLKKFGLDEESIYATRMLGNDGDGIVRPIDSMVATGEGKIAVMDHVMEKLGREYGIVIDDGTTGINVMIEAYNREWIPICFNPNVPMMRNFIGAIFMVTGDLNDVYRLLTGDLDPVDFDDWKRKSYREEIPAIYVGPDDDIGVPRTMDHSMPYGFKGYGCDVEKGSLAYYVNRRKKEFKGEWMTRFGEL